MRQCFEMVYYIFKGNTWERNRCMTSEHCIPSERCCPHKNHLTRIAVSTSSPPAPTGPVRMTEAKYRNKLKAEADLRLCNSHQ